MTSVSETQPKRRDILNPQNPHKILTHPSQSWWHALDANVGLLVLVDHTHQLLGILSIHQHDRTGKGVRLSELAVACSGREEQKIQSVRFWLQRAACMHDDSLKSEAVSAAIAVCGHLGCSVGIVTDVEDHSLGSFVEGHAGL